VRTRGAGEGGSGAHGTAAACQHAALRAHQGGVALYALRAHLVQLGVQRPAQRGRMR
jgi:hypothetical protein